MNELEMMINEQRLIILLETEEANVFNQVILNEKQFKGASDAIFSVLPRENDLKEGFEIGEVKLSEDIYELPELDGLNSINS